MFVLTHAAREPWTRQGGTTFFFVTDDIASALDRARAAAGAKAVRVSGGAETIRQYIEAGLIDEFTLHIAAMLLGTGIRLLHRLDPASLRLEQGGRQQLSARDSHQLPDRAVRAESTRNDAMQNIQRITPFLWFDDQAEEAVAFYTAILGNSRIVNITRYGEAGHEVHGRPAGTVMTVAFELEGQAFTAFNGGPAFKFNEAISFQVNCETREEVDYYWERLSAGGDERHSSAAGSRTGTAFHGRLFLAC